MTARDDDFNPRTGRIHHGNQGSSRQKSFVGEVMRAAKKSRPPRPNVQAKQRDCGRSTFDRGRQAALSLASPSSSRRVVVMQAGSCATEAADFVPRRSRSMSPTSGATE